MKKIGIIGAGKMATAITQGALSSGYLNTADILVYDVNAESRKAMTERNIICADSIAEIAENCENILLAVKPQVAPSVLCELGKSITDGSVIISIVAGVSAKAIGAYMGKNNSKVIQVMPNTPIMVGLGATALCRTSIVEDSDFDFAKGLFSAAGVVEEIPEDKMNEIIAVHGSTPAYIYLITKYFCEYAEAQGIPMETANRLFCQTLSGAAKMMTDTGLSHQQLIEMVSSPGGTTLMGLASLEKSGIKQTIDDCCDATIRRAYELGQKQNK